MLQGTRLRIVQGVLVAFAVALVLRAGWVQLWQGERWERMAARQHYARNALPAPRGEILDIAGVPLAQATPVVSGVLEPSARMPMAENATVSPVTTLAPVGVTTIALSGLTGPLDTTSATALPGSRSHT